MTASATIEKPAAGRTALLVIDMLNDMAFEGAARLAPSALAAAERIALLRRDARKTGVPVVFVNDNFGQWHSERSKLIEHCRASNDRSRDLLKRLGPPEDDEYFVIKPMHSGF
jgi:nicotinamidase-related amidase